VESTEGNGRMRRACRCLGEVEESILGDNWWKTEINQEVIWWHWEKGWGLPKDAQAIEDWYQQYHRVNAWLILQHEKNIFAWAGGNREGVYEWKEVNSWE